jgi:PAS domain S-box-containing protein
MGAQCAAAVERARLHDSERRLLNRERLARERLEELAAKNRLQSQLIDLSTDGIILCDSERRVISWNRGAEKMYGWTASEASGRNIDELLRVDHPVLQSELLERGRWEGELVHSLRDGSRVTVESRHVLVKDAEGAAAYLEINRDLTDRRRNEEALRNAQKLETVGQLAGGIAHDFNNLLTAIIGHASALEHLRSAQDRMSVAAILEAGGRAAELTRQLLAYSGKGQFVIDGVDLSAVVRDVYDLLRAAVPASAVLHLELASGLPPISVDPAIPTCDTIRQCLPIFTLCAICTRLSTFVPSPITVSPRAARSTVVPAPSSTSSSMRTIPICGILKCFPSCVANP